MVVAQQNFKGYYGPFAERASFSLASSLNPNFADVQHLQAVQGVGEVTARKIAQARLERPFTDVNDLVARIPQVHFEHAKLMSFFPFQNYILFFPLFIPFLSLTIIVTLDRFTIRKHSFFVDFRRFFAWYYSTFRNK